jgi:hypothetical protein
MIPTPDTTYIKDGGALLTSRYVGQKVTAGMVKALMLAVQDLENAYQSLINGVQLSNHPMAGGPWRILDQIGAIVGVARNGLSDTDYLVAIRIKIRINRSHGLAEDIIQIMGLVVTGAAYSEAYPASFEVDIYGTTASIVRALLRYLHEARSAATEGFLNYSITTPVFILDDQVLPLSNAGLLDDSVAHGFSQYTLSSMQVL